MNDTDYVAVAVEYRTAARAAASGGVNLQLLVQYFPDRSGGRHGTRNRRRSGAFHAKCRAHGIADRQNPTANRQIGPRSTHADHCRIISVLHEAQEREIDLRISGYQNDLRRMP